VTIGSIPDAFNLRHAHVLLTDGGFVEDAWLWLDEPFDPEAIVVHPNFLSVRRSLSSVGKRLRHAAGWNAALLGENVPVGLK
jgi:hypothetical protein